MWIEPQLAAVSDAPPGGQGWLHEIKLDGVRILVRKDRDEVRLFTRNGLEWSERFPVIAEQVRTLPVQQAWFDGELVVLRQDGSSCFGSLQRALARLDQGALTFCAFDVMHFDGRDMCCRPLDARKELLHDLVGAGAGNFRYVEHVVGQGADLFEKACTGRLEGIVSKQVGSLYRPGSRSRCWVKTKWKGYKTIRPPVWSWWRAAG